MRYHEVGVTKIRSHQKAKPHICKNILGYGANALYLWTMLREMPCGKGKVVHYTGRDVGAPMRLAYRLKNGSWFGFAEVDIEISGRLWRTFEVIRPFVYNKQVPENVVLQNTLDYLQRTGRNRGD